MIKNISDCYLENKKYILFTNENRYKKKKRSILTIILFNIYINIKMLNKILLRVYNKYKSTLIRIENI